jgi:hypothetical protein
MPSDLAARVRLPSSNRSAFLIAAISSVRNLETREE